MSSPTPAQRATAAHRLDFAMRDLELASLYGLSQVEDNMVKLREAIDVAVELMTRA